MDQVTDVLAQAFYKHQTGADWDATRPATKVAWRKYAKPFARALNEAGLLINKTCKGQTK